jgi:hypothetical protein
LEVITISNYDCLICDTNQCRASDHRRYEIPNTASGESVDALLCGEALPRRPPHDPIDALVSDKRWTAWLSVDDALQQIRSRYAIYTRNIDQIEQSKCAAINAEFTWHLPQGAPPDAFSETLHARLQDLYRQQRDERTALWRDVSRLRASLPESMQRYLAATHRASLLDCPEGEAR